MNQPWVYTCPIPPKHPSHLPSHHTSKHIWTTYLQISCHFKHDLQRPIQLSHVQPFVTPWTAACQAARSITHSRSPSSWWCHPIISSSIVPFSSCLQSFPASGFFLRSQFFTSGGQSIGASASASVLPMNIQYWFPLGLTGLIFLQSERLSRVFYSAIVQKRQFFSIQLSLWSNSHIQTWWLGKTIALTIWTFVGKVMSLLFNMLSLPYLFFQAANIF